MRIVKVKSNKHADVVLVGDALNGPNTINMVDRLRMTSHGLRFVDLVTKVTTEVATAVLPMPPNARRSAALHIVDFCHEVHMAAMDKLTGNPSLAITVPSYDALLGKLRGAEADADKEKVISMLGREL